jgi:hypothetical protein
MTKYKINRGNTELPTPTKIKLWLIMKDYPKHSDWEKAIAKNSDKFDKDEYNSLRKSYYFFNKLKGELTTVTYEEVKSLPKDLQQWIISFRPDLKRQEQKITEQPSKETFKSDRLKEHIKQVTDAASLLASGAQKLLYYQKKNVESPYTGFPYRGNLVIGIRSYWGSPEDARVISIEGRLARCVLAHYEHKFNKLPYNDWEEIDYMNASPDLADNLVRLSHDISSEPCPICPACQELAGLPDIGRNWTRVKDKKTGRWSYMPDDF